MASRRSILTGSAVMLLDAPAALAKGADGRGVAAAPHPDAGLIDLCRRYVEVVGQIARAINVMPDHYDWRQEKVYDAEHVDPLYERKGELLEQIQPIRARTMAGLVARVELLAKESPYLLDQQDGIDETMISGILLDGLALKAGGLV